jgi:ATP-dependent DNA ligase
LPPTVGAKPSSGDGWIHEIKHDGYRLQVHCRGGRVRLLTRRGFDWTSRFPWIVESAARLKVASVTFDGGIIVRVEDATHRHRMDRFGRKRDHNRTDATLSH